MTATPTKLRDGTWGARVSGRVSEGDLVTIRTSTGKTWQARITRIVWAGKDRDGADAAIVATASTEPKPATPARRARIGAPRAGGRCRGCRGEIADAPHHRAMHGYCGSCAFDEFDC